MVGLYTSSRKDTMPISNMAKRKWHVGNKHPLAPRHPTTCHGRWEFGKLGKKNPKKSKKIQKNQRCATLATLTTKPCVKGSLDFAYTLMVIGYDVRRPYYVAAVPPYAFRWAPSFRRAQVLLPQASALCFRSGPLQSDRHVECVGMTRKSAFISFVSVRHPQSHRLEKSEDRHCLSSQAKPCRGC